MIRNRYLPTDAFSTFAALVCFATFFTGLTWVTIDARRFASTADFKCFYAAGRIVAEGQGSELYVPSAQARMLQRVIPGNTKYFYNPPAFVLPFVPLSRLSLMTAYWFWTALSLVALLMGLRILLRLSELRLPLQTLLGAAALAFEPTYQNLRWGNISAFVLLLVALFFRDLMAGKERRAGIWLALLMVKPELFLITALVLAAKRKWRCIRSYLAGGVALLVVSWVVVGTQGFVRYVAMNLQALHGNTPVYTEARLRELLNWRSLFARFLGGGPAAEGLALALTVFSGVILYLVWRGPHPPAFRGYRARWALTVLFSILMAPHFHIQSLIIVVAAASLLLSDQDSESAARTERLLPHLALTAAALSWLPEINLPWGLTAIQIALIATVFTLSLSLLTHAREATP